MLTIQETCHEIARLQAKIRSLNFYKIEVFNATHSNIRIDTAINPTSEHDDLNYIIVFSINGVDGYLKNDPNPKVRNNDLNTVFTKDFKGARFFSRNKAPDILLSVANMIVPYL